MQLAQSVVESAAKANQTPAPQPKIGDSLDEIRDASQHLDTETDPQDEYPVKLPEDNTDDDESDDESQDGDTETLIAELRKKAKNADRKITELGQSNSQKEKQLTESEQQFAALRQEMAELKQMFGQRGEYASNNGAAELSDDDYHQAVSEMAYRFQNEVIPFISNFQQQGTRQAGVTKIAGKYGLANDVAEDVYDLREAGHHDDAMDLVMLASAPAKSRAQAKQRLQADWQIADKTASGAPAKPSSSSTKELDAIAEVKDPGDRVDQVLEFLSGKKNAFDVLGKRFNINQFGSSARKRR